MRGGGRLRGRDGEIQLRAVETHVAQPDRMVQGTAAHDLAGPQQREKHQGKDGPISGTMTNGEPQESEGITETAQILEGNSDTAVRAGPEPAGSGQKLPDPKVGSGIRQARDFVAIGDAEAAEARVAELQPCS